MSHKVYWYNKLFILTFILKFLVVILNILVPPLAKSNTIMPIAMINFGPFFLSGFSFTTIHKSQDCRGRRRAFLELLTTTSTHFTDT